jgi:diamine N-acetyltransferase
VRGHRIESQASLGTIAIWQAVVEEKKLVALRSELRYKPSSLVMVEQLTTLVRAIEAALDSHSDPAPLLEQLKASSDAATDVTLREITKKTLFDILRLRVAPEQARFVAPIAVSIAEAHFSPEVAWFRAIYFGETPVGFVMLEADEPRARYFLWRFMVDAGHQGRGIGRRAIELVIEHVRTRPGATELTTSCVPGDGGPGPFYEKLGFVYTGSEEEGELVMRREL